MRSVLLLLGVLFSQMWARVARVEGLTDGQTQFFAAVIAVLFIFDIVDLWSRYDSTH